EGQMTSFDEEEGLYEKAIHSLAVDQKGDVWIGTFGGGIYKLNVYALDSISRSCIKPVKKYIPKIDIDDLFRQLPIDIFFLVYNLLLNPSTDEEIILAPHQEELDI
ncbi:MAG: hypothetical protein UR20_C0012G0009, partial [Candidatus Woesebacteria bacterium GW2011_GWE2_31_6]